MLIDHWRQRSFFTRQDFLFRHFAVLVASAYAAVSITWIALSDKVLGSWAENWGRYEELQTLKGWFFVMASALLIYYVLNKAWQGIIAGFDSVARSEERLSLALSCAGGGIWELDLVGNEPALVHMSDELAERLGIGIHSRQSLDEIRRRRHPEDAAATDDELAKAIESGGRHCYDVRYRVRSDDGVYHWVHSRGNVLTDAAGRPQRMVGVAIDIDKMMRAEEEVERLKRYDPATGLAKRGAFLEALAGLDDGEGKGGLLGLVKIQLSAATHRAEQMELGGEPAVIRLFAERLRGLPDMFSARLSTDVFALAPSRTSSAREAQHMLEEAVRMLLKPLEIGGETVRLRAQIGGALGPLAGNGLGELLRMSAQALEQAEMRSDGVIRWSDERLNREFLLRNARIRGLEHAVANGEIECYFQPLIDLRTGRTAGFEALARWNRPEEGLVAPDKFIALAEELGLIGEIGEEMLRQACSAAVAWPSPEAFVAVNVSPLQLNDPAFPELVRQVLADTGLPPVRLELEITENALLREPEEAARRISDLRELGVQVAIDDFGTGYSSFGLISKLPFSRLKIDRSFISGCLETGGTMVLVDAMAALGKNLNLSITAEGVETAEQAAIVAAKGVDIAQGYLFSRPIPAAEAAGLIDRDWSTALKPSAKYVSESHAEAGSLVVA